jgi:DNA topoisomerase I
MNALAQKRRQKNKPVAHRPYLTDPIESAKASRLRYISDDTRGIMRQRSGNGFRYLDPQGKPLRDAEHLRRIKSLVIPPAWQNVWISPFADSHLQATGRDAKDRKQYRYHPRWREVRDQTKYDRMLAFGRVLPRVRARVKRDLALPGLPRRKVIATVVQLLETTLIRVGNEEYARQNHSFGLTTMRNKHVKVKGTKIRFEFRGKSGVEFNLNLDDRRLAKIVKRCQELPGQELFQYIDEAGERRTIDSTDVNQYLREVAQEDFTAKDFRTWAGTVLAARALREIEHFDSKAQAKRNIVSAIETVAKKLGNTRAVCRKCYIHPAVVDSYLEGSLVDTLRQRVNQELAETLSKLRPEEAAVMAILEQQLKAESKKQAA